MVLEIAGFEPEFCKWISMMYHNPQAVAQVNGRRSRSSDRSSRAAPFPLFSVLAAESLNRRFRDERALPALRRIPKAGRARAKISPTGAKLVGSTSLGRSTSANLTSKAVVLKREWRRCAPCTSSPWSFTVCRTLGGVNKIPFQTPLERTKPVNQ